MEPAVAELQYSDEGDAMLPVTCSAEDSNPPAQVRGGTEDGASLR